MMGYVVLQQLERRDLAALQVDFIIPWSYRENGVGDATVVRCLAL